MQASFLKNVLFISQMSQCGVLGLFLEINGQFVLICAKILEDLFFAVQKTHFSSIFERKRGVHAKGKTENFGCFMEICRSPDSPNGEFKTKKASRFDWRRLSKNVPIGTLHIGSKADDASYCETIVKQCFI